ncbi:hypothetical protein E2C01_090039 [Portunus trituberculatus]|uniref:Uncharacterized protein n=1 Tax=Portunus trituberculatus TaxID=210409 RepID=A0A5B7JAE6_PORTR|nr:hypothetical protein [Portunus trituberculatus]
MDSDGGKVLVVTVVVEGGLTGSGETPITTVQKSTQLEGKKKKVLRVMVWRAGAEEGPVRGWTREPPVTHSYTAHVPDWPAPRPVTA